jgi:hypothetical protein
MINKKQACKNKQNIAMKNKKILLVILNLLKKNKLKSLFNKIYLHKILSIIGIYLILLRNNP